jgi:hypothetical protein
MLKKLALTIATALLLTIVQTAGAQDSKSASEDVKHRPNKQEIIDSMVETGRMPAQQQRKKIDSIWQDPSGSKTPRSDFLFCIGLAYSGDYKAQRCLGSAYENGRGIVEDLSEAYTWYAVALENRIDDKTAEQLIDADKERVKARLLAVYPHPAEEDLDDLVRTQKAQIATYREDVQRIKK